MMTAREDQPGETAENDLPGAEPAPASPDAALWAKLRGLTAARIGLARSGASIATAPLLDFRLAHAQARDAVHERLDAGLLADDIAHLGLPVLQAESAAQSRRHYLMRPDLGRRLTPSAKTALAPHAGDHDVVFVICDGLSPRAAQRHAAPLLAAVLPTLRAEDLRIAPAVIAMQGRVAIGDEIAMTLQAACVAVLIGERPGLSAPYSMGAYLTWRPHAGTADAERNCISNIRPEGMGYAAAADRLSYLLHTMRARRLSGVALKDESDGPRIG